MATGLWLTHHSQKGTDISQMTSVSSSAAIVINA